MTVLIVIVFAALLAWVIERLDQLHADLEEVIATIEQRDPPRRG